MQIIVSIKIMVQIYGTGTVPVLSTDTVITK